MTTSAYRGHGLRPVVVRAPAAPRRVTVLHGHRHLRLWHGRVVLGSVIGGAMAGALLGVAWTVSTLGTGQPAEALKAYGFGALAGAAAGLLLGLVLSAVVGLVERYLLPNRVAARGTWVRYRR